MITYIHRSKLEPHPDNPRQDLGDVTELAASIKKSGLLQNLTVVPHPEIPDHYRIIIGHRRFAASELAGLEELPCVIEDMPPADQMATMLAENMQRSDLTIADQVGGMQLMMNLGESIKAISSKTGLSETSVRKRVTLSALPKKEMRAAVDKGATLIDLMGIMELEDASEREDVLKNFGTNNWQYSLTTAKDRQAQKKFRAKVLPLLGDIKPIKVDSDVWNGTYSQVCSWQRRDKAEPVMPELDGSKEYRYKDTGWQITLYVRNDEHIRQKEESKAKDKIRKALVAQGKELSEQAYELRAMFVRNFRTNEAQRKLLWEKLGDFILGDNADYNSHDLRSYHSWGSNAIREMIDVPVEKDRDKEETFAAEMERRGVPRERLLLAWALNGGILETRTYTGFYDSYTGRYQKDSVLERQYQLLEALGYQPSDFENSLRNGSHPFFHEPEVSS